MSIWAVEICHNLHIIYTQSTNVINHVVHHQEVDDNYTTHRSTFFFLRHVSLSLFRFSIRSGPFHAHRSLRHRERTESAFILALLFRYACVGEWCGCIGGLIFRWNGILCKDRKSNFFMYFILRENKNNVKFIKGFFPSCVLGNWTLFYIVFFCVFICKDWGGRMRIMEKMKKSQRRSWVKKYATFDSLGRNENYGKTAQHCGKFVLLSARSV